MAAESDLSDSNAILFANKYVTCYEDHIVINMYYFPAGNKKVKYSDMKSCELLSGEQLGFSKVKMWGMALSPIWWHADFHRHSRDHYIVLDINSWPKIGLTMDDSETPMVYKLIKEKMDSKEK